MKLIYERVLKAAKNFKHSEAELIEVLREVEAGRLYLQYKDCTDLYKYIVKILGLSEDVAYNLSSVARKSLIVPELRAAIQNGLGVSKARKVIHVLTPENQSVWIKKAETLSCRKLEAEVAKACPLQSVVERMRFVGEDRLELKLGISESLQEKLLRIQDLESQRLGRAVSLEESLEAMAEHFLEKNDPVRKAERVLKKKPSSAVTGRETEFDSSSTPNQIPIPSIVKHEVRLRDQGQCVYQDSKGLRCNNKRWVEIHHIKHRQDGGANTTENLITLCSAHRRGKHRD